MSGSVKTAVTATFTASSAVSLLPVPVPVPVPVSLSMSLPVSLSVPVASCRVPRTWAPRRPLRSTVTRVVTGPHATGRQNVALALARWRSLRSSTEAIARSAAVMTTPPCAKYRPHASVITEWTSVASARSVSGAVSVRMLGVVIERHSLRE